MHQSWIRNVQLFYGEEKNYDYEQDEDERKKKENTKDSITIDHSINHVSRAKHILQLKIRDA